MTIVTVRKIEVHKCKKWLNDGIVRESSSDFANSIAIVLKKDFSIRL